GTGAWRISFFHAKDEVAVVDVDGRSGRVISAWTGPQVGWPIIRGEHSAFKDHLEIAMLALCLLFMLPFLDPRRPWRLLHLDLLAFVAFMVSLLLFDRGHVYASVPLQYPPLLYLLGRLVWTGWRGARAREPAVPLAGERLLIVGVIALLVLRAVFNLELGRVGDVGYAGVFGADSIHHGWPLYTNHPTHLDTYGPVNYLLYLPFESLFPFDVGWQRDSLSAAHSASLVFDLAVVALMFAVGRRMKPGPAGRKLGVTLAYLWVACPFTFLPLAASTNDAIVPAFVLGSLLALSAPPLRGALIGLGAAAKFAPMALVPLFALGPERSWRKGLVCAAAAVGVFVLAFLPYVRESGLHKVYDSTLGFQLHRASPFTLWGLHPSLEWMHLIARALAASVIVMSAVVYTGRDVIRVAAFSAAVILAVQMAGNYWAHTYVMWFAAPALVALAGQTARDRQPA
ncbi:MAG: hypothetical protein QOJ29_4300, partial [Thermoleophilaceae bacterium]|nr:hypothetical protein [Thermoleophilaceae bacterium]